MYDDKDVICLATGSTYEIVTMTAVTAHPATAPYPRKEFPLLVTIKKGGYMEIIYTVQAIVECLPSQIHVQKESLTPEQFSRLQQYHYLRSRSFGYGHVNTTYRYYILSEKGYIAQPFQKKNIQVSVKMSSSEIPMIKRTVLLDNC